MKILVLNGSPKGEVSVTMQYVKYLQKQYPAHEFKIASVAQDIRKIERESSVFEAILEDVRAADGVLWAFPLYVLTVHGNYKRFIELIFERGAQEAFKGKYTAVLSTSIHFFDHTAHNYMHAICDDLEMKYTGFFSAEMQDLTKEEGRKKLVLFAKDLFNHIENKLPMARRYPPIKTDIQAYMPGPAASKADNSNLKVLLITEGTATNENLSRMAARFKDAFTNPIETVDLDKAAIKGGCLGCIHCGYNNECVYGDRDDVISIYTDKIAKADIIVYAVQIKDRNFSAHFKTFIDRRFFRTHQPQMCGKQVGYIIAGPLGQNENLQTICQGITELDEANLAGILCDDVNDSGAIDAQIDGLAGRMVALAKDGYVQPQTFLGVGGAKVFRDEIWLGLRFSFEADHKYFKKHGKYDFPQKQVGIRMMVGFMMLMNKIPAFRKYVQKNMRTLMLGGYKKVFE